MSTRPIVLTIAGNDSAGMAGVSRDIQTIQALGAHAASAITACTAQNASGLVSVNPCDALSLTEQLNASLGSAQGQHITAIKIGLLATTEQVILAAKALKNWRANYPDKPGSIILDPVLAASSGEAFLDSANFIRTLIQYLLPLCGLITPNMEEASALCGRDIKSSNDMEQAAQHLLNVGAKAVLVKGGHAINSNISQDYFHSKEQSFWLSSRRVSSANTRGTGCTLSSAIAAAQGLNYSLADAIVIGKMAINQALADGYNTTVQSGPAYCIQFPNQQDHLPTLTQQANSNPRLANKEFAPASLPSGGQKPLGLYPVVDSAQWCNRLLPLGVSTLQLRVKQLHGAALEKEINTAVQLAKRYDCRLFINDYWELAIKYGAYGVHLGQEDLEEADIEAIHQAGLRLGISTHCHYEVARAHALRPSYIACGPVFHTTSKDMPWIPHGPEGFAYWREVLNYPLVAIGGINADRIQALLQAGANGIAMISAITEATDPEATVKNYMQQISSYQESADKQETY